MCGVLALAFGSSIFTSVVVLSGTRPLAIRTPSNVLLAIIYEALCLGLLFLVLWNQERRFSSIGFALAASLSDVLHSAVFFFVALLSSGLVYQMIALLHQVVVGRPLRPWDSGHALFGHAGVLAVVFVLLNPFFEELLVRGYLMTEIQERYGGTRLAIVASVGLQTSYHLYQGLANATVLAILFACFALYFSRTKRIVPVILAHMYFDVLALLAYARP